MRLFCFGYGYVAQHLAQSLRGQGWHVAGTSRRAVVAENAQIFPLTDTQPLPPAGLEALAAATYVLVSIPPAEDGSDCAYRHHAAALADKPWLGYLSTTGVYGDYQGGWVDETSALLAEEPRSIARIRAEKLWRGYGAQLFRLAGIYGPQRNALEQVRAGTARRIHKPGQYFSRIHVEDIVQALCAAMRKPQKGEIFNLCDDEPAPAHEVVAYACGLLGVAPPPLEEYAQAALSPMARSFYAANRRVRNGKMKTALRVELLYSGYRSGLASILHRETVE